MIPPVIALVAVILIAVLKCQAVPTNAVVETLTGGEFHGTVDGQGTRSMFDGPRSIAVAPDGAIYCLQDFALRIVSPSLSVRTIELPTNGQHWPRQVLIGRDGDVIITFTQVFGTKLSKYHLRGMTLQPGGETAGSMVWNPPANAYFATSSDERRVYKNGIVFVGSGNDAIVDGDGLFCSFRWPTKIAVDAIGDILVLDSGAIRKVTTDGNVTTIARLPLDWRFAEIACSSDGRLIVSSGNTISSVAPDGSVRRLCGGGSIDFLDAPIEAALLGEVGGLAFDQDGNLIFSDFSNNRLRAVRRPFQERVIPPARLVFELLPSIRIEGVPGALYRIESAQSVDGPWETDASIQLVHPVYTWVDESGSRDARRIYRVVGLE